MIVLSKILQIYASEKLGYLVNITEVTLPQSALSTNKQSDQDEPASDHETDITRLQNLDHVNSIQCHCYQCLTATDDEVSCLTPRVFR